MLSVLVGAVVVAEEVLGMVGRSELVSTGHKEVAGHEPGGGVGSWRQWAQRAKPRNTDLHPLPIIHLPPKKRFPPPSRTHSLMHAWLHVAFLLPSWCLESKASTERSEAASAAHTVGLGLPHVSSSWPEMVPSALSPAATSPSTIVMRRAGCRGAAALLNITVPAVP